MTVMICSQCGTEIGEIDSVRGQWIPCPGCHENIHIPLEGDPQAEAEVHVADDYATTVPEPYQAFSAPENAGFSCPGCGVELHEDLQFCTSCGFNLKPEMSAPVAFPDPPAYSRRMAEPDKGLLTGAYIFGAVGAVVAGLLWGLVAYITKMEFGFGAIGVGFLVATAVCLGTSYRGKALGRIAVMMAVLGLIVGKVVIANWVFPAEVSGDSSESAIMEVINDEDLMADAAYCDLVDKGGVGKEIQEWAENAAEDEPPPKELVEKYQTWPLEKKKEVARNYLAIVANEYAKLDTFTRVQAMLSFWDILWAFLAVSTAYRICARERRY